VQAIYTLQFYVLLRTGKKKTYKRDLHKRPTALTRTHKHTYTAQAIDTLQFYALQGLSAGLVVVFNTLMKTSTQLLAQFERHSTLTLQVCCSVS